MSHFRAILLAILSFYSSSSLMGMESEELKGLLLFRNADITDKYGDSLPKEIKDIITKNRYLILASESSPQYGALDLDDTMLRYGLDNNQNNSRNIVLDYNLTRLNKKDRIQRYKGTKIVSTDFDLMTINNEGKQAFERLLVVIPHRIYYNDIFKHPYPYDFATTDIHTDLKDKLLLPHQYDSILKLPLNLRRKIGELLTVKVVGQERDSLKKKCDIAKIGAPLGSAAGIFGLLPCLWKGYLTNDNVGKIFPIVTASGATLGAIAGVVIARDRPCNRVYNVEEKPLITLKEQITIKSSDENKAYNDELKFLLQHQQAMDENWKYQSEEEKELNCEIFNHNRKAIEEEIESLKNHRMIFTHSHMKNSDFEKVQMERNAAKTKEIWNNLPLHKKIIYGSCSSPINPDVEIFNNLQNKYYAGLEKKKLAIRE